MTDIGWLCLTGGLALGFAFGLINAWMYRRTLIDKSHPEYRTPEKIGAGFYYIVPEREYVQLLVISRKG